MNFTPTGPRAATLPKKSAEKSSKKDVAGSNAENSTSKPAPPKLVVKHQKDVDKPATVNHEATDGEGKLPGNHSTTIAQPNLC